MTPKSKNILVGLFVVILSMGSILFITWLGSTAIREETDTYLAYLDEAVSGLSQNSPVKYKGVTIGQVEKIQINPNNSNQVELQLLIKRGTPIKVDSKIELTSQGITGLQYIEITGGSEDQAYLEAQPGEKFPVIPSGKSTLATVQAAIGPMLGNIDLTIQEIRQILESANPQHVAQILSDVKQITNAFANNSNQIFQDVSETGKNLRTISEQTNTLVRDVNNFLDTRQDQLTTLLEQITASTNTLNRLLLQVEDENLISNINRSLKEFNQLAQSYNPQRKGPVASMIQDIRSSTERLNRLLEQFENEKIIQNTGNTLGQLDTMAVTINQQINGPVAQLLQDVQQSTTQLNKIIQEIVQKKIVQNTGNTVTDLNQLVTTVNQNMEGPWRSIIEDITKSTARINRLLEQAEQEGLVSNANKTIVDTGQVLQSIKYTSNNIDQFVTTANQTTGKIDYLLNDLQKSMKSADNLLVNLNQTTSNIDQLTSNLDNLIQENTVKNIPHEINTTLKEFQTISQNLNQVVAITDVEQVVSDLKDTLEDIRSFAQSWTEVADEVGKDPSALIFGDSKQEIDVIQ